MLLITLKLNRLSVLFYLSQNTQPFNSTLFLIFIIIDYSSAFCPTDHNFFVIVICRLPALTSLRAGHDIIIEVVVVFHNLRLLVTRRNEVVFFVIIIFSVPAHSSEILIVTPIP